jgi:hypothetical protein
LDCQQGLIDSVPENRLIEARDLSETAMTPEPDESEQETSDPDGREAEVASLRQRLAFFESFERIIQENIARSGELLHLAARRQAEADEAAAAARNELDREIGRNRQELSELGTEIAALRDAADGLVGRIAAAVASADRRIPSPTPTISRSDVQTTRDAAGNSALAEQPPVLAGRLETPTPTPARPDEARGAHFQSKTDVEEVTQEFPPGRRTIAGAWRSGDRTDQSVIVHGVSGVPQARSLVDHLRTREAIDTVEPKEFLDGILRLAVAGRQLRRDDFEEWGGGVELVEEGPGALVLRLPGSPSL